MRRLKKKHPLVIRWCHWINFPLLFLMSWSGILIYWADDVFRIGWGETDLFRFFPESFYAAFGIDHRLAEGMAWHFLLMWLFALNGVIYAIYTIVSGEWRYLVPGKGSFAEAWQVLLHDLRFKRGLPPPVGKFNGAQKIAYTGVILMGLGSILTGVAIYKPIQASWLTQSLGGYEWARFFHFWLMMGFFGFFMIHLIQVARAGWNAFRAMVTGYEVRDERK